MRSELRTTPRRRAGFSLIELVIAVSIMVMMTGAVSPALVRYIEKGRERRDAQSIDMVCNALGGALYDEIAYDAVLSSLSAGGVYAEPLTVEAFFSMDDSFSEAVRYYIPTAPRLASKAAIGPDGDYEMMMSIRQVIDADTGIRTMKTAVWAGNKQHCADKTLQSGVLPDFVTIDDQRRR